MTSPQPPDFLSARSLIQTWYPAPLARPFGQLAAAVGDPTGPLIDVVSATIRYLALVALSDHLSRPADWNAEEFRRQHRFDRKRSDGSWLQLLRYLLDAARSRGDDEASSFEPELGRAFFRGGLDQRLSEVVALRNRLVHGAGPGPLAELQHSLVSCLGGLHLLRFHRLLVPVDLESRQGAVSSYRAVLFRGHVTPYPVLRVVTEAELQLGRPYLARGGHREILALYPAILAESCDACGGSLELFMLSHTKREAVLAEAPITGHRVEAAAGQRAGQALSLLLDGVHQGATRLPVRHLELKGDPLFQRRALEPGDLVAERYRIGALMDLGGATELYQAIDTRDDGAPVALKLLPLGSLSQEAYRRFYDAIRVLRRVRHPNIVSYRDHGEHLGEHFLALDLVGGWAAGPGGERVWDLASWLNEAEAGGWPAADEELAVRVGLDVAEGLHALHQEGFVHRNLTPRQILLCEEADGTRRVRLTGLAGSRRVSRERSLAGMVVGSPEYQSPEQLQAADAAGVGPSSDLYSLGVILYQLLAGEVPLRGETPLLTAHLQVVQAPPPLEGRAPGVSQELCRLVMRCLAKDPAKRFPSAARLHSALIPLLGEAPRASSGRQAPARDSQRVAASQRPAAAPASSESAGLRAVFLIEGDPGLTKLFVIGGDRVSYGRSRRDPRTRKPNDLVLQLLPCNAETHPENWRATARISRNHGLIELAELIATVTDTSSRGTVVDGAPLRRSSTGLNDRFTLALGAGSLELYGELLRAPGMPRDLEEDTLLEDEEGAGGVIQALVLERVHNVPEHRYLLLRQQAVLGGPSPLMVMPTGTGGPIRATLTLTYTPGGLELERAGGGLRVALDGEQLTPGRPVPLAFGSELHWGELRMVYREAQDDDFTSI